jgi:hypothetical protein
MGAGRDIGHVPFDLARLHLGQIEDVVEGESGARFHAMVWKLARSSIMNSDSRVRFR